MQPPITDHEYKNFAQNFPTLLTSHDWMEILEAFFLDSTLRGLHADKALALACARSGMRQDQAKAFIRALFDLGKNAGNDLPHAIIQAMVTRTYAEYGKPT